MNKNIWNLYKNSERGKNAIEIFTINEGEELLEKISKIYDFCEEFVGEKSEKENFLNILFGIYDNIIVDNLYLKENENIIDFYERFIDNFEMAIIDEDENGKLLKVIKEKPIFKQKDYKNLSSIVSELSLVLYCDYPEAFVPILFPERFDKLINLLDALNIELPQLPTSVDKRGRLLFYNNLCENIFKFAEDNELTPPEICACIYDFGKMLIQDDSTLDSDLPEPTNIWLTGGSKSDYQTFLKNPPENAHSVWTCNEQTKRGDIIVMYVLSPYSCIQSIWRANTDGVFTPFNYYNSRTTVTNGIVLPEIKLDELKTDEYFKNIGIVRKNFQGVNGVKFSAEDYSKLQRILKEKGFDTSILPQLYSPDLNIEVKLKNEKDVEENLLIPLLKKLGYTESDWTRQLSQKAGRKEKAIPDFVFFPKGEIHFQNAPLVIEAKYDMSSSIERMKSYNQALSYARMMQSPIFAICDKDRLIVYKGKDNSFNRFKPTFEKHWQNLNDAETFNTLKKIIGKDYIKI
ncbi:type I restriction enzyme HsdR N-terminal domain-containing protein [Chryseobacterium gotjawalense]|uniref:Type I restriction enzyme HsdR N-terminal domain-containing protein n=1 Tax=Chryseobacterium gotjawalense TaxID=3042315 RepID=A0ABY8RDS3_9FLAO|nr:type I restriction enzyme HsdR N-terminal domain-containing protein [Chryseobacterium sp. wdc7]WHF52127.1 type I restriction enzyme HsdR N-terminal domain-containing protein [Chryseobacterium sp. wdc7]